MGPSRRVIDDRRRVVEISGPLSRVVSLVPSDTLNVAALGCASALVGRTDYCELPADVVAGIPSVGGTKNPRVDDIVALEPRAGARQPGREHPGGPRGARPARRPGLRRLPEACRRRSRAPRAARAPAAESKGPPPRATS